MSCKALTFPSLFPMLQINDEGFITPQPPPFDDNGGFDPIREVNHLMATNEAKDAVYALRDYLSTFVETTTTLSDGRVVTVLARATGDDDILSPWDIQASSSGGYELFAPKALKSLTDLETNITITNSPFTPAAGQWLVAKITDLTTLEIETELVSDWEDYPSAYEFTEDTFEAARLPLWQFFEEGGDGRELIVPGVFGEKRVPSRPVEIGFHLVLVPGEFLYESMPRFI